MVENIKNFYLIIFHVQIKLKIIFKVFIENFSEFLIIKIKYFFLTHFKNQFT